ncbi:MAG TPA: hypothetical protein ENL20_07005 [Candidatus Cloacimonetes bacterium]|nr:hypothetical protein [Candidatus Cloacimonadota bacterium]
MKEIIKNEKGAIILMLVAMIVVLVSVISAFSLINLVQNDHLQTQYQNDKIQEELLLRSEAVRTQLSLENDKNKPLPEREVEILANDRITTYTIENKKEYTMISNFMGYATAEAVAIRSLASARRSRIFIKTNYSPIKRYSERLLRNESLAQYQYFSDEEASENAEGTDDPVKFWGPDVLNGPVHSNSDIWIQQAGGGNNMGWPTFHAMVSTAGIFRKFPEGTHLPDTEAPMDQIFQGGWQEEVASIIFEPTANDIKQNGIRPFDSTKEIVYVKLDGNTYSSMYGDIEFVGIDTFGVYSWYPHTPAWANAVTNAGFNWFEDTDHLWTNYIPMYDTLWTSGPSGTISNQCVWMESELWIEGVVAGKQTWGSADTVFVVGDIWYDGTPIGTSPDDEDNPNRDDYFGLVSEQKILIRYKHKDPFDDMVVRTDNCNDIYLYGAYAAIADGNESLFGIESCHYDGIFTFQYHHMHGSTPDFRAMSPYTGDDTLFSFIDFHKFIYPPNTFVPPNIEDFNLHGAAPVAPYNMCGFPYEDNGYLNSFPNNGPTYAIPYGTDWPYYNPIWPESAANITTERGAIHIFGAIAQRRRGFVHRSGSDPFNHPQGLSSPSPWDIEDYHYSGNHPSCGYDKDYYYDNRFLFVQPPCYPQIYRGFGDTVLSDFKAENWMLKIPPK